MTSLLDNMSLIDSKYVEAATYPVKSKTSVRVKEYIHNLLATAAIIAVISGTIFGFYKLIDSNRSSTKESDNMAVESPSTLYEETTEVYDQ